MKENYVLEILGNQRKYLNFCLKMQTSNIWKTDKIVDVFVSILLPFNISKPSILEKNIDLQKTGLMHLKPGSKYKYHTPPLRKSNS